MVITSAYFAFTNLSTVENLARRTRIYNFAVLLPQSYLSSASTPFRTITYPLVTPSEDSSYPPPPTPGQRTFAILFAAKGRNPYSLSPLQNFKQVMGNHVWDWFLPIKYSPCCTHDVLDQEKTSRQSSMYPMGAVFEKIKAEAGLPYTGSTQEKMTAGML